MITIEQTGTTEGYEDYYNDYLLNGKVIASSSYDKNQRLHVCSTLDRKIYPKNIYRATPEGIATAIERLLLAPNQTQTKSV